MSCLIGSRFNMRATVLRQAGTNPQENPGGHWETRQDPDSGAIERVWVPDEDGTTPGDQTLVINCMVRGVTNGGIRAAGTTQRFSEIYENVDWAVIQFPASVVLSKYDRVTNITNARGDLIWREEEIDQAPATVFQVMGSTPVIDPFGNHIENTALLQRAQVQNG
ncbi:hypothetical protein SEA_GENIE2_55 [Streptomyces phage Genie2]|uniref:Head-to-tail stopper n=1 Tax=Streptomyces phage Genie2 TaxID=2502445 RepID=A0A411C4E7_9CAUD|nr:hypothetical protein SEA_GENIE2_55 [Streptomyces phage Genie2]UVD39902.1 head-to-tail stopper [Streptomyces phage Stanimal]WNM73643.1 head-to-tail stopper [Streptomyces phage Sollertia]